jgi:hypothetical protein
MFEERDMKAPKQGEFWVVRDHLPSASALKSINAVIRMLVSKCDRNIAIIDSIRDRLQTASVTTGKNHFSTGS